MPYFVLLILFIFSVPVFSDNWHDDCNFGMHFDIHAKAWDTVLGAELTHENLKSALEKVDPDWIQCDCKGHPGYTSWPTEVGSPSPGIVKDALKIHSEVCKELGIKLGMHYSGVLDSAACELHPEWQAKDINGNPCYLSGKSSAVTCLNSEYVDRLMIPQMIEVIDKYDVDGFWVDGDCWGMVLCYCDRCKKGYKEKYGLEAPKDENDPNFKTWVKYHRELFFDYVNKYTEAVHKRKPDCLVVSNWMLTFGAPVDDCLDMDYISGDLSHIHGLKSAALEGHFIPMRGKDWDLMVWGFVLSGFGPNIQKTALQLKQECAYISACGGASMIYETLVRNGLFRLWHFDIFKEVTDFLKKRGNINRHSVPVPEIALIHNPDDFFGNRTYIISVEAQENKSVIGASDFLNKNHYQYSILLPSMIKGRMAEYKTIIIPESYSFSEDFKNELKDYVDNGGNLIVAGQKAAKTFENILGAEVKDSVDEHIYAEAGNKVAVFREPYSSVSLKGAKVLKYRMYDQNIGSDVTDEPIVTVNSYGKGKAVGIYFDLFTKNANADYPYSNMFFKDIMDKLPNDFCICDAEAPDYVHFILNRKENNLIVNLVNTGSEFSRTLTGEQIMTETVPPVSRIKFKVRLDKKPQKVKLASGSKKLKYNYSKGFLNAEIKDFEIYESLVIDLQ